MMDKLWMVPPGMAENWRPRVALVVGVGSYDDAPLENPVNDARDLKALLEKKGGFKPGQILCEINPTRTELMEALEKFRAVIRSHEKSGGCVALLFYAGGRGLDHRKDRLHCMAESMGPPHQDCALVDYCPQCLPVVPCC